MVMNTRQKIVLILGLLGIALASLFPPWSVSCIVPAKFLITSRQVEYAFLFDPPTGIDVLCNVSLDIVALITVWTVILAITFGLALLLGIRRSP